jgi:hypothetical protein
MDAAAFTKRITALPASLETSTRRRIARTLEQLRIALDLPSRKELAELTSRLEALDARIASLAAERVAEMGRTVPTLPEPAAAEPAAEAATAEVEETETKKKPTKTKR